MVSISSGPRGPNAGACRCRGSGAPGFTLIELLVVLAIVATLLSLVVPRYYSKIDATKELVLTENLRTTRQVIGKFHADTGRYPQSLEELVRRQYLAGLPMDPILESATAWIVIPPPDGFEGTVYDIRRAAQGAGPSGVAYGQR